MGGFNLHLNSLSFLLNKSQKDDNSFVFYKLVCFDVKGECVLFFTISKKK